MVFGKDKKKDEEEEVPMKEKTHDEIHTKEEYEPRLSPAVLRALGSITKTVDMFKDTVQDVLEAEENKSISEAELKDLVSRCKSYSLIVEKEFKIMRRRMAAK